MPVFGVEQFKNEIIWLRATPRGHAFTRFASSHDVLFFYCKTASNTWNSDAAFLEITTSTTWDEKTDQKYALRDPDGRRYQLTSLLNPNRNRPNLTYEFLGITRVWRWTRERMTDAYERGLIVQPRAGSVPRYKRFLDEQKGKPLSDVWGDIPPINSQAQERLGYPTQKPEALLERIIKASSNEGDIVLDPFCGCGTAVVAAQRLNRRWIGIDITPLATNLIKTRLTDIFGPEVRKSYEVIGEPTSVPDALELAKTEPTHFQYWALGLVDARPVEERRGADRGIDGRLYFHVDNSGKTKQIIFSVKAGQNINVAYVRDLRGVIEREKAAIGVLITMEEPTKPMMKEAAEAGFYKDESAFDTGTYPRIQILTVEQLLNGAQVQYPRLLEATFKKAPKARAATEQLKLDAGE